jgi:HEAT repeat protein
MGILMRGVEAVKSAKPALRKALADASPSVRVVTAEALGRYGDDQDLAAALDVLLELARLDTNSLHVALLALNAIDSLGEKAAGRKDRIKALPRESKGGPARTSNYAPRLLEDLIAKLDAPAKR